MDELSNLTCAICFDKINPSQNFMYGRRLPFVKGTNVCAHQICLCIRESMSPERLASTVPCPDGISISSIEKILGINRKEHHKCAICAKAFFESSSLAVFPKCHHKLIHLQCLDMVTDITRRWSCPICPLNYNQDELALAQWRQPRKGQFATTYIDDQPESTPTNTDIDVCDNMSIIEAIEKSMPALAIKKSFDKRKDTLPKMENTDTVGKWLIHALKKDTKKKFGPRVCLLEKLHKHKYTARDVLTFGITFEMIIGDSRNIELLLDRDFFVPSIVAQPPLLVDFTKLMLAGVDIGQFVNANYTSMDLNNLHFTMRGFIAAGGTFDELSTLRTKIKDTTLCTTFSFTSFMEECLQKL